MAPGTTLAEPVTEEQRPDLRNGLHEINEYLMEQGAYDLFSYLLKDLVTVQPKDPLQHMLDCLHTEYKSGPLKVIVSGIPGIGRSQLARHLAGHFGLEFIGAGELLAESGVDTTSISGYADEGKVAELVMHRVEQATSRMQGFVLDGFPRTRLQTSFLKEKSVVPTHILSLKATTEFIWERQRQIAEGELEGVHIAPEALEQKLRMHSCHSPCALETYESKITVIDMASKSYDDVFLTMEKTVRMLPRSRGPQPPPRVVLLGPRGIGVKEHASRLAARLGAVFVDGEELRKEEEPLAGSRSASPTASPTGRKRRAEKRAYLEKNTTSSMDLPNLQSLVAQDKLKAVGVRLQQPDCRKQGWVMCSFPTSQKLAEILHEDLQLRPTRVVVLQASVETCVSRLRHVLTDPATGKVWTSLPKNEQIRKRLQRNPQDQPAAVKSAYIEHSRNVNAVVEVLDAAGDGRCTMLPADGAPEAIHSAIVEFVERPLPLRPGN